MAVPVFRINFVLERNELRHLASKEQVMVRPTIPSRLRSYLRHSAYQLRMLLWGSAGAVPAVVRYVSPRESLTFTVSGLAVWGSSLLTFAAFATVTTFLTNWWIGILAGILACMETLFTQRAFLSSLLLRRTSWNTGAFLSIFLRALILFLAGLITAVPLELSIFSSDINRELAIQSNQTVAQIDEQIAKLTADTTTFQQQLQAAKSDTDEKLRSYIDEVGGSGGPSRPGQGPVAKIKLQLYKDAARSLKDSEQRTQTQVRDNEVSIASLQARRAALTREAKERRDDIGSRIAALEALIQKNTTVRIMAYWIIALNVFSLLLPMISLVLARPETYMYIADHRDYRLAVEQVDLLRERAQKISQQTQEAFSEALDESAFNPSGREVKVV